MTPFEIARWKQYFEMFIDYEIENEIMKKIAFTLMLAFIDWMEN